MKYEETTGDGCYPSAIKITAKLGRRRLSFFVVIVDVLRNENEERKNRYKLGKRDIHNITSPRS